MVDKKVGITLKGRDLASKALGKVRGTINRIKSAVFSLQGALVGVGVLMVGRITRSFVTAFTKQQDAVEGLRASLIATGKDGEASLRRLTEHAAELQKVTKVGDEATIAAMASLALMAPSLDVPALERAQRAMIGLADVFFKGDLEAAALQIGKTVGGTTNALSRYTIEVDMAGDANARMNQIVEQANRFFDVSKARAQTLAGRLARLGNSWGDLKERIGQFLGESPLVNAFLDEIRTIVEDVTGALNRGGPQIFEAFAALGQIAGNAFVEAFLRVVQLLHASMDNVVDFLGDKIEATFKRKFPALKVAFDIITKKVDIAGPETARPETGPTLIDRMIAERQAARIAARERLAAAGAGFAPPPPPTTPPPPPTTPPRPPTDAEIRRADLTARFGGQLPGVQGAVTRGVAGGVNMSPLLPRPADLKALVTSSKEYGEALRKSNALLIEAKRRQEEAAEAARAAAVAALQSWAFAASELIRSLQGGGLFGILGAIGGIASLLPGGQILGGALLAGSAVGGALSNRNGQPVRVDVERFGSQAEGQLSNTRRGLERVEITIVDPRTDFRRVVQEIQALEARDGIARTTVRP